MAKSKTPSTHPNADLRRDPSHHDYLARDLEDATQAWRFGAWENAWADRTPYPLEDFERLERVEPWRAFKSGWPGARPVPKGRKEIRTPGRPALPFELRRQIVVTVMVNINEAKAFEARAQLDGKTMSAWVRDVCREACGPAEPRVKPVSEPSE